MPENNVAADPSGDLDANAIEKNIFVDTTNLRYEATPIDPEIEKKVLRKIDLFLMPAMVIGYGLVYYDKTFNSLSSIPPSTPPITDTSRLSWATSIFYFGQLVGSYPLTYMLQYFNTRYVLGPTVLLWGITCAATAGVTTWQGLFAQRFFLGFAESIIPTCFMVTVSGFYTQSEQALRQSWWWSGTAWFTIIGSAISYGFAQVEGSLHPWQYVFILAGALTFLFGIWCFFLPTSPVNAWFLDPEERIVATERLRTGQTGLNNKKIKLSQVKESVLDIKLWLICITMISAYTVNGAVSGFGPLIVSTFGYSTLESILFQFPLGGIAGIGIIGTGWLCSKYRNIRVLSLVICCLPVIAGFIMIWKSDWGYKPAVPVAGYSLLGFFGPVVALTISLGAGNVAGSTKRSFTASAIFVAYCVGNIIGPQLIRSQTKDRHYPELWTGLIICYCITITSASLLYVLCSRENKRRESLALTESERVRLGFEDLTDKENVYFRYVY
ncbi:MFS general substrate transporter [Penicillium cosmopolitanum]|uniref:MFS general substrate transporter n=1 Tax=Penicillium cosmopolitanum TaxID=1131564 RepID=A0A9X0BBM3_9EURO|nr:MFS general substrate transporter [Penicillium cosmopolitanum]KAJ5403840.1 MFS general substrate transporter [Penicillium cosmopolitanum]